MRIAAAALFAIALVACAQADPTDPSAVDATVAVTTNYVPLSSATQSFGSVSLPAVFVTTNDVNVEEIAFRLTAVSGITARVSVDAMPGANVTKSVLSVLMLESGAWKNGATMSFWSDGVANDSASSFTFSEGGEYLLKLSLPMLNTDQYACAVGLGLPGVQVEFDKNGGTLKDSQSSKNYTVGYPYARLPEPTRADYVFDGWFTAADGGEQVSVTNLAASAVTNLYAHWSYSSNFPYNVVFHPNGGVGNVCTQQFTYGEGQALQSNQFTYSNHVFVGWARSSTASREFKDGEVVTNLVSGAGQTCSLYAKWMSEVLTWRDSGGVLWHFTVSGDVASIENCDDSSETYLPAVSTTLSGALAVPETVVDGDGVSYVVTKIGERAFAGCAHVTEISVPDSVTALSSSAFLDCVSLRSVEWSDNGITSLPEYLFAGCSSLASVEIPYTVTEIGSGAFYGCTSLKDVTVPENVDGIGDSAFQDCSSLGLVRYLGDPAEDVGSGIYSGTPSNLVSAALSGRSGWDDYMSSSTNGAAASTWQDRALKWWTSSTYSLVRVIFDPAGGTGGATNYYVKGHAYGKLPDEPTYGDETDGDYTISHEFLGWFTAKTRGVEVAEGSTAASSTRVYAQWGTDVETSLSVDTFAELLGGLALDDSYPLDLAEAAVYDGYVVKDEKIAGTVQVRVAKGTVKNGVTNSTVTATVVRDGVSRAYSATMKNGLTVKLSPRSSHDDADYLVLSFSALTMVGEVGEDGTEIQATRTLLAKPSEYVFDPYVQFTNYYFKTVWTLAAEVSIDEEDGVYELDDALSGKILRASLSIGAKGVVKITGIAPNGTPISANAQLMVGDGLAYVPVSVSLKDGSALNLMFVLNPTDFTMDMGYITNPSVFHDASGCAYSLTTSVGGLHNWEKADDLEVEDSANAMVGVAYKSQVTVGDLAYPVKFSARGLPTGLKIDATTGVISGVPTKAGSFETSITVASGVSAKETAVTVTDEINISDLPSWAAGSFSGYLAPAETVTERAPGAVTMTVGKTGKISGKIQHQGTNWTFTASSYDVTSDSEFGSYVILATAKAGKITRDVSLLVEEGETYGTFGELEESETSNLTLWRNAWKDRDEYGDPLVDVSDYVGYYTAVATTANEEGEDVYGYIALTVNSSGGIRYSGKMPDGTALSGTTTLLSDGFSAYAAIYVSPSVYKGGCAFAFVSFDFGFVSDGGVGAWINQSPTATSEYGTGFIRSLAVYGAYYSTTAALSEYYSSALKFSADQPGLDTSVKTTAFDSETGRRTTTSSDTTVEAMSMSCWESLTVSLNSKGTAFVVDQVKTTPAKADDGTWVYEGENDAALTFSFAKATGIFKGSFTSWYDYDSSIDETRGTAKATHVSKRVSFEGIANPSESLMSGFYLLKRKGAYEDEKTGKTKTFTYAESHAVKLSNE